MDTPQNTTPHHNIDTNIPEHIESHTDWIKHIWEMLYSNQTENLKNGLTNYYTNIDKKKIICIFIGIFMVYFLLRITSGFIIIIGGFLLGLYLYELYHTQQITTYRNI